MPKYVPEILVNNAYRAAIDAHEATLPLVHNRQRLNDNINKDLADKWGIVRDLAAEIVNNAERRVKNKATAQMESSDPTDPSGVVVDLGANQPESTTSKPSTPIDLFSGSGANVNNTLNQLNVNTALFQPSTDHTTVQMGVAYRGSTDDIVTIPVKTKPFLHQSQRGSWSWRTTVHGYDSEWRHINVKNLHSIVVDKQGNYYVKVNGEWQTDQPVFRDYCNKSKFDTNDIPF